MTSILSDSDGQDAGCLSPLFSGSDSDDAGSLSSRDLERPTKRRRASLTGERVVEQQPEDSDIFSGGWQPGWSDSGDDIDDIMGNVDDSGDDFGDDFDDEVGSGISTGDDLGDPGDDFDDEVELGGLPPVILSSHALGLRLRELRPFQWALGVLQCLEYFLGAEALRGSLLLGGFSFATHFSGVGAAERSVQCLTAACPRWFAASPSLLWSCDKRRGCCRHLLRLPGDSCVFTNILDISREGAPRNNGK